MSDGHGHDHGHSSPPAGGTKCRSDNAFQQVQDYITKSISSFVSFLFVLIALGAVFGYIVGTRGQGEWLVIIPAVIGLIAYYNRDFALIIFVAFLGLIFLV